VSPIHIHFIDNEFFRVFNDTILYISGSFLLKVYHYSRFQPALKCKAIKKSGFRGSFPGFTSSGPDPLSFKPATNFVFRMPQDGSYYYN